MKNSSCSKAKCLVIRTQTLDGNRQRVTLFSIGCHCMQSAWLEGRHSNEVASYREGWLGYNVQDENDPDVEVYWSVLDKVHLLLEATVLNLFPLLHPTIFTEMNIT